MARRLIILVLMLAVCTSCGGTNNRYNKFINQCIVDNKTLPDPLTICSALWYQQEQGGR